MTDTKENASGPAEAQEIIHSEYQRREDVDMENYSTPKPRLSTAETLANGLPKYRTDGGIGGYASGRKLRRALAAMQRKGVK